MNEARSHRTVVEIVERLREAGYADSPQTVRRLIDSGAFGAEGRDWYRTERGGHRQVKASAVERFIEKRRNAGQ